MTQASSVDYSTLKYNLLKMWLPVTGVRTPVDLWTRNFENYFGDKVYCVMQDWLRQNNKETTPDFLCKPHFENYFDSRPPFEIDEVILSGSCSEGLFLYSREPSDRDFMCVLKNITFSLEDQQNGCLWLREDTPFVYAFMTSDETQNLWCAFLDNADKGTRKHRLSSRKLKEKLQENSQKTANNNICSAIFGRDEEVTEGAAMTISKPEFGTSDWNRLVDFLTKFLNNPINEELGGEIEYWVSNGGLPDLFYTRAAQASDVVLAIFCEGWPSCAREWITRKRLWPDMNSVEKISNNGYHIVPKSSPDGDFRLSFSCVETMLVETLIPLQRRVMRAFKAVVKYHENTWSPNLKNIISSYHLKTIAFWHFERTSQESWTEDTLVHHLVALLEELAEALRIQNLPMYFMPKVNLVQDVDNPEVTLDLMEKISQLSQNFCAMSEAINNNI
ncbi:Hypothetical predicted protein [Paramuricea clavata]|uniref:Uncharacterized protein n=1 Tax=Paramuricea clavata TaxID=317549 RepID=A0A7D9ES21_PARCT|nr:Hypothetical predicted protein [Paramuricea clavata]